MPSPFPGMDPYLEGPLWPTFHYLLSGEIARQLTPKLRPRYIALPNDRFVYETGDIPITEEIPITTGVMVPDVGVVTENGAPLGSPSASGSVMTLPLMVETFLEDPQKQLTVEIRDAIDRRLVTVIDVLSPTNKRGEGRNEYLAKRNRILHSSAHLVEIDLLRAGARVPTTQPLPSTDYFVFVTRVEKRPVMEVWPVALSAPLPSVPIPLLKGDADVTLNLQAGVSATYDSVGFDLAINYKQPPSVPLSPDTAEWANEVIRNRNPQDNSK